MDFCKHNTLRMVTLAVVVALSGADRAAQAQDLFGRTEKVYDLTRSPKVRDLRLDYEYIRGAKPTYAEQRGLAGAATVEVRRNFVYVHDTDGILTIPFQSQNDLVASFNFTLRELYRVEPDEFVFVYMFTSFDPRVGAFFYQPEANDVRGMGEQLFDMNGSSTPREGFVFMNYWQSFEDLFGAGGAAFVQAQARSVFNQEAGHRWCSFVNAGAGINGGGADVLLGRDEGHWSYFLNSGGSPMEGNGWRDNGNGTFTTTTNFQNWHFSPLDMYLMGLIPPAEVPAMFAISSPNVMMQHDMFGDVINRASPPQIFDPIAVSGTRVDITIDEIVARNGTRMPAAGSSPTRWRAVFVMLASQPRPLNENQRVAFEEMVDDYALGFKQGVGDRAELDYLLMATPKQPIGGLCGMREECDSNEASVCLIVPPVDPGQGMCTRPCGGAGDCPQDWCCQAASTGVEVCLPQSLCTPPDPPDGGIPEMPDSGMTTNPPPPPPVCTCDMTYGCDEGCEDCDPECPGNMGPCLCDTSYACDTTDGVACECDRDCTGKSEGCGCLTAEEKAHDGGGMTALSIACIALASVLALRRRKR